MMHVLTCHVPMTPGHLSMPCLLHHTVCVYPCCHRIGRILVLSVTLNCYLGWMSFVYPSSDGHLAVSTSYPLELGRNKLRVEASLVNTDPISSGCLFRSETAGSDHTAVLFLIFQGTFLVFAILTMLITSSSGPVFLHFLARACFPLPSREREGSLLPCLFIYFELLHTITFDLFIMVILTGAKWYPCGWICLFLQISDPGPFKSTCCSFLQVLLRCQLFMGCLGFAETFQFVWIHVSVLICCLYSKVLPKYINVLNDFFFFSLSIPHLSLLFILGGFL